MSEENKETKGTDMKILSAVNISICCWLALSGYAYADPAPGGELPPPPGDLYALSELDSLDGNYSLVEFDGAVLSSVDIEQDRQGRFGNKAHVKQTGLFNRAKVDQRGGNNSAFLEQVGAKNYAKTTQIGNDNESAIIQHGAYNESTIMQNGNGNYAVHIQEGYGHKGEFNQIGDNNVAYLKEKNIHTQADYQINQIGDGMSVVILNGM